MKTKRKVVWALATGGIAVLLLTAGCASDESMPPPSGVAVVGFVPDYCFWDGYEYIGWDDGYYYYWGPDRAWVACDSVRVRRVHVWMSEHPHWRAEARPVAQYHPATTKVQPSPATPSPHPLHPPHPAHPVHPAAVNHQRGHEHGHDKLK